MIGIVENDTDIADGSFVDAIAGYLPEAAVFDVVRDSDFPSLTDVDALVLAGSRVGVYESDDYGWIREEAALVREAARREIPVLGICFGHQLVHYAFGGRVEKGQTRHQLVQAALDDNPLFADMNPVVPVLHGDYVVEPAAGFETIATAEYYDPFATRHATLPIWTVQFHPEYGPQLAHLIDDWTETEWSFDDCNSSILFENFDQMVTRYWDGYREQID
jgi:GMP synthase (glutamine-hydrolysing)